MIKSLIFAEDKLKLDSIAETYNLYVASSSEIKSSSRTDC